MGVRLFGPSYIFAFGYLLAPGAEDRGVRYYPTLSRRMEFVRSATSHWGYDFPGGYDTIWTKTKHADPSSDTAYLSDVTDAAVAALVDDLIDRVDELMPLSAIPLVNSEDVDAVERFLRMLTPAPKGSSLPAIVNAGWRVYFASKTWEAYPAVHARRNVVLNELLLKSAQVGEVAALLGEPT